ncbi:MAG: hypothetical protein RL514_3405 [Verrucomicrobiota bacterium]|jgi:hypothetical protein
MKRTAYSLLLLASLGLAAASAAPGGGSWEATYHERQTWWSLQPVRSLAPPAVKNHAWCRTEVDRFILAGLEQAALPPAPEAAARTLARRLSFALTGLPPRPEEVEAFVHASSLSHSPTFLPAPERAGAQVGKRDSENTAYERFVDSLLASPHFGERWARHWMDVVHYADTHGYEWDAPAKHAWRYRDYLVRAFNDDVPFKQLALEQLAGDLLPPRVDPRTGLNESLLGPMALRLGERRHGDNAAAEGVTQEAIANIIDTVGKGFLGSTVACAQCHDHKLDAISQRDYYALAGIFMSTRWGARCADATDPNLDVLAELRRHKQALRAELAKLWLNSRAPLLTKLTALPADEKASPAFPDSLASLWRLTLLRSTNGTALAATWPKLREEFQREREKRVAANQTNLTLLADFTRAGTECGWRWDGSGMKHGFVRDGEPVVADEGETALAQLLPAGRWSHAWSQQLAGAVRSPLFAPETTVTFSAGYAAGRHAARAFIVDQAFHSERLAFLNQPQPAWLTLTAGNFDKLAGGNDTSRARRVYLELATKSLNNYFPPRTGYGGLKESDVADERSWFGLTRVYQHAAGKPPQDELTRFATLFANEPAPESKEQLAARFADTLLAAVTRWTEDRCNSEDVRLLNEALTAKWLPNESTNASLALLVAAYRATEKRLQPDRTIGSADDWNEARDERLSVRGTYTEFADVVPRGNIRLLGGPTPRDVLDSSGRLELARSIASDANPLTARVFVNRVWLHLFGEGLVRTPDDFGHLGERPVHPELLDYLAARFVAEGWSLKKLVRLMVTSATWRQAGTTSAAALTKDAENRLWHHFPQQRLDAESIRDALLAVSGRLDPALGGEPIDPYRTAQDAAKRLFSGPLDGLGRRSLYLKMTLMEPPKFLALFNQPIPKLTTGKRDVTNVPDQALALLNDPFVLAMAKHWGDRVLKDGATTPEVRAKAMFAAALGRPPRDEELPRLVKLASRSAELHGIAPGALMACAPVWQDVAHALFNVKEFIYVH